MLVQVRRYPVQRPLWNEIADFEREVGKVFGNFFTDESENQRHFAPAIDVVDKGDATVLSVEMPGVSKEDVKISMENDILTVSGTRKNNTLPEKASWLRNEIKTGEFTRSVTIPKGVDAGKITAEMSNGVLKVVLPKAEEVKPREIRIS